ncbi:MAG: LysM peptidoglycan-binding protein [Frankiales bacterium]|jgi:LysM repeat protein|nr:LysM peptidoglycan-binding protein [Frankiales bacterium]
MNSTLHLTRRGRLVIVALLAMLLFLAFLVGRTGVSSASTDSAAPVAYTQTTVQPGETLWAVAKRVAPHHDPRALVDEIRDLNHLASGGLRVGQQLLLPHTS